jgi:hypothetical protein
MLSRITSTFTSLAVTALALWFPSQCRAQPQEVFEEINGGLQCKVPATSIAEIRKAWSNARFETKGYEDKKPFGQFVKEFEKAISKYGKEIQIVIERDAFRADNDDPKLLDIRDEEIGMPPVPTKLVANTALRLALAQVGRGSATYWFRRGQIVITSIERAQSSYFLKSAHVSANSKDRRLVDMLDELAEETGVSIVVDARVANQARTKVTAKCGAKLETVVRLLAQSAGLQPVVLNNVIYVTSPANAREFKPTTEIQLTGDISGASHGNVPLLRAFDSLAEFSNSNWSGWVIDSKVKKQCNVRVTAKWHNYVQTDVALRVLTDMAGLRHVVIDDVAYITSPANAKKLEEERN